MPLNKLSAAKVKSLGLGKYNDGGGLWLWKRREAGHQWILRVTVHGRRREMGLGGSDMTLAEARAEADKWRKLARTGIDPIKERERLKREAERARHTFQDVLAEVIERKRGELKNDTSWQNWDSPLRTHIIPKLGKVPIAQIDARDIYDTLKPIWNAKAATAKKSINRLGQVMTHAAALGLDVDLQAVTKARALLGRQTAVSKHIEAMDWREVPAFYQSLGENPAELALRFLILTASRSGPVRLMHENEIFDYHTEVSVDPVWIVPPAHMKAIPITIDGGWRIPITKEAARVLELTRPIRRGGHIFVGTTGKPLSDAGMARVLDRRGIAARPHGFRSSFKDWAEAHDVRYELAELCLGHNVGNKVERAYRRDDFLAARGEILDRWAAFVVGGSSNA
ncbi:tyrosine-type recombinase/integrase [Yoonia sp.]|uniref:tyrosine-type recombinase/integrase n=1 Tax=Yoonia sp. TaxID=2212373 RepID=UPI00358FD922